MLILCMVTIIWHAFGMHWQMKHACIGGTEMTNQPELLGLARRQAWHFVAAARCTTNVALGSAYTLPVHSQPHRLHARDIQSRDPQQHGPLSRRSHFSIGPAEAAEAAPDPCGVIACCACAPVVQLVTSASRRLAALASATANDDAPELS